MNLDRPLDSQTPWRDPRFAPRLSEWARRSAQAIEVPLALVTASV